MSEEELLILKMIQEGKLTAEEGAELLDSIREDEFTEDTTSPQQTTVNQNRKKKLRIRVTDTNTGKIKANISVPSGLIRRLPFLMPKEAKEAAGGIDFNALIDGLGSAEEGKLLDIDDDDGEHVEIFFE